MNAANPSSHPADRQIPALTGWLAPCFAVFVTAVYVSTGGWFAELHKPPWIFCPVWTLLYVMMAVAAWLVWRQGGWRVQGRAPGLFLLQWLLNALWLALAATLRSFGRVKKAAAILLLPYLAWVSFAAVLSFAIWRLNP